MHCVVEFHEDNPNIVGSAVQFVSSDDPDPAVERQECRDWIDQHIEDGKRIDLDYMILRLTQTLSIKLAVEVVDS